MPLVNLGQINNAPISPSMQADDASRVGHTWANVKGDGTTYGLDNLLDDLISPIEDKAKIYASVKGFGMAGYNLAITSAITQLRDGTNLISEKAEWLDGWQAAFQANPSVDLSKMISDHISQLLGSKDDGKGLLWTAYEADDVPSAQKIIYNGMVNDISAFMKLLAARMPKFLDEAKLSGDIKTVIASELGKFNLLPTDDGLDDINDLTSRALETLETGFEKDSYLTSHPNGPYRSFDQDDAKETALKTFKELFHKQEISDKIVTAAFNKAIKGDPIADAPNKQILNLGEILKMSSVDAQIDERLLSVLDGLSGLGLKGTPVELYEKMLGKKAGDEFIRWYGKWKWLIRVEHKEVFNKATDTETINMHLQVREGAEVISKDGIYPNFVVTPENAKITAVVKTEALKISSVSYVTNAFKGSYNVLVDKQSTKDAVISEDALYPLFSGFAKDGDSISDVKIDELIKLDPIAFSNLQKLIDDAKKATKDNLENLYKGYKYDDDKVKVSFNIVYTKTDDERYVTISATISDENVKDLPTLDWKKDSETSLVDQGKVNDLFKKIDAAHSSAKGLNTLKQNIVSPFEKATSEAYKIFSDSKKQISAPYKTEFIGAYKEGQSINQDDFSGLFDGMKTKLDEFNVDNKGRFTLAFKIDKISDDSASISYVVTDTKPSSTKSPVTMDETVDHKSLNNIVIVFNKDDDKAIKFLKELQEGGVDDSDFKTEEQISKLRALTPPVLTPAQFKKLFPTFDKVVADAKAEGVTLVEGKLMEIKEDGEPKGVFFKEFIASYTNPKNSALTISHNVKIPFTTNFATGAEVAEAKAQIDKDAELAKKDIDTFQVNKDDGDSIKQKIATAAQVLKDKLGAGGVTQDELDAIKEASGKFESSASDMASALKKAEILKELGKQFPSGVIPKDVLSLFESHWQEFEDIIKNHPELLKDAAKLKKLLDSLEGKVSGSTLINVERSMKKSGKIALLSLGGMLGLGGLLGGANAVKVATTNKKAVNAKTGKIKSSKKLAVISALIGLASAAGSIGTFVYLFVAQGGL